MYKVFLNGYLSIKIPIGIYKKHTGRNVKKYRRLNLILSKLYGAYFSGFSRACGMSSPYPYPKRRAEAIVINNI
jgi:hypothetical protein